MTANEAAERLRGYRRKDAALVLIRPMPGVGGEEAVIPGWAADAIEAAERRACNEEWNAGEGTVWHYDCGLDEDEIRRATVERIRERLYEPATSGKSALYFRAALAAILDEEAAR